MIKRFMSLLVVSLLFLVSLSTSLAQGAQGVVVPDGLNVRATPTETGEQLGTLSANTTVTIVGREDDPNNGGLWVLVEGNGLRGWVLSDFLSYNIDLNSLPVSNESGNGGGAAAPAPSNADAPASNAPASNAPAPSGDGIQAEVTADSNLRAAPDAGSARVGGAFSGTVGLLTQRNADGSWVRGTFNGVEGWISTGLVNPIASILNLPTESGAPVAAPVAEDAPADTTAPASAPPPPVAGGASISGFAYGAHVAGFDGVERMSAIGMTWMKKQIRYSPGDAGESYAGLINDMHSRGFRALLGVVGDPVQLGNGGDEYFNQYAGFVAGLAASGADAIEIWNEPNIDREWPTGQIDPARYTQLLAVSYNAIKGANPNTIVISGAPAPTGFFGGCSPQGCDDNVFLQGMAAAGAASYMDCVGAHYNEGIVSPSTTAGDPRSEHYTRYYPTMVNTYAVLGKPICFTELGYLSGEGYGGMPPGFEWGGNNTLAEHAQWTADVISLAAADSRVRLLIVWNFNFRTDPSAADPAGGYAMVRPDGSCPACEAIGALR